MSFPSGLENGIFDAKHRRAMGSALWTYGVLVDWQTNEEGWVLGGKSVSSVQLGKRLGLNGSSVRHHLRVLQRENYVELTGDTEGYRIRILRPKKRFRRAREERPREGKTPMPVRNTHAGEPPSLAGEAPSPAVEKHPPPINRSRARRFSNPTNTQQGTATPTPKKGVGRAKDMGARPWMIPDNDCQLCDGTGWVMVMQDGREYAKRCVCKKPKAAEASA